MAVNTTTQPDVPLGGSGPLLRATNPWRFWTFLSINLIAFAVVNAFWQYLSTGQWVNFAAEAYRRDFAVPISESLHRPLDVFAHPWMILVTGLLLAVVIFVPIVISLFYRLVLAAVFVLVVALVGHAPILALALAAGCLLASRTHLRRDLPFLAALMGMAPAGLYLYLFGFASADSAAVLPLQRWVLYAPFLVAMVAAPLAAAAVLTLARITGYRPGLVWPVMGLLLAGPLVTFYLRIGPDELDYSLITNPPRAHRAAATGCLKATDEIFPPVALETWRREHDFRRTSRSTLRKQVEADLVQRKRSLDRRFDRFGSRHPRSHRAAAVLWLEAQSASLQLDSQAFEKDLVKYTASYPLEESGDLWRKLRTEYPASPQAALANWRLGQLALREGDIPAAQEFLALALGKLAEPRAAWLSGAGGGIFAPPAAVPSDGYYADALFRVEVLVWLIEQNDLIADEASARAMSDWLKINPEDPNYVDKLDGLARKHRRTNMANNLWLAAAKATGDDRKKVQLLVLIADDKSDDAYVEANYQLGRLAGQMLDTPRLLSLRGLKRPEVYFQRVRDAWPSPWRRRLPGT